MTGTDRDIAPIAMPGIHARFLPFLQRLVGAAEPRSIAILDAGAGHGALSKPLHEAGFRVSACDARPELFQYTPVECRAADLTERLPYPDASFDFVIAVEVMEHLPDHERFFREAARVLKRGGRLVASTPNIVSLKSRLRFLLSGFFYSFKPIAQDRDDGLQHVSAMTPDQYRYVGRRSGVDLTQIACDKYQATSIGLLWLVPAVYIHNRLTGIDFGVHSTLELLLGRILFLVFAKP